MRTTNDPIPPFSRNAMLIHVGSLVAFGAAVFIGMNRKISDEAIAPQALFTSSTATFITFWFWSVYLAIKSLDAKETPATYAALVLAAAGAETFTTAIIIIRSIG